VDPAAEAITLLRGGDVDRNDCQVTSKRGARWALAGLVIALVLALDQATKALVTPRSCPASSATCSARSRS
jgi:hypothetical protein